ncbi:MAG: hypothetical protein MI976_28735 [Pseudomonadales bacterium]|nr:hypothetical protein [Pseudomonadales bacterium]
MHFNLNYRVWQNLSRLRRYFAMFMVAMLLTACKTVTVEQPTADSVHITPPDIVLSFPSGRPDPLQVNLNGQDITSLLTVTDSGASVIGADIVSYLVDGKNALKVVNPNAPTRFFIYDISGPMVHLLTVTEGANLVVSGYVEDPSGITSVTANGVAVSLDAENRFSISLADDNYVTFESIDNNGYVRTQTYARPNVIMNGAMGLRVARSGLDFAVEEIEQLLVSDSLSSLLAGLNPILEDSILGNDFAVNVNSASIDTAAIALNITGTHGNFNLQGDVYDLVADFTVDIDYVWPLGTGSIDGQFFLDHAGFNADATVTANAGGVDVSVNISDLDLDAIRSDINNFPDWLLTPIYEIFEWLFEIIIEGQVESLAEEKLTEFLDAFPDSVLIDIDGNQVKPLISPESVSSPDNGLNLGLGAHIYALTENGPNQLGSAYRSAGTMPTPTESAPNDEARDVGIVISENMINQALSAVVESGILNISMTAAEVPGIGDVDPAAGDVRVRIIPTSAPTIDVLSAQAAGLGTFAFQDFYIAFDVIPQGQTEFQLFLGATLDLQATADLGITEDNAIAIEFIGAPTVVLRDLDDSGSIALNEDLAQSLLDEFIPVVLPPVMNAIGAIPLPSFEGYGVNVGSLWVMDSAGDYVGLTADLVKVETTAGASAPSTFARLAGTAQASNLALSGSGVLTGDKVVIAVGGDNPSDGALQFKYSLDGAPFGLWKQRKNITLYNLRSGQHTVSVCSRSALLVEAEECARVVFEVE